MKKKIKKKIIVLEPSPYGTNIMETTAEETKNIGRTQFHLKKKNPNRNLIWKQQNRWKELFEIVEYTDKGVVLMFISGGPHRCVFKFDKKMLDVLLKYFSER